MSKIKNIGKRIKVSTWISLGLITILLPIAIFRLIYSVIAAPDPPTAYWKMDEGADDTCPGGTDDICDDSGNTLNGIRSGATWTTEDLCVFGKCLEFDGSNDTVNIDNDSLLNFERTDSFSVSFWMRTGSSGAMTLISKQGSSAPFAGWNIQTSSDGYIYFQLVNTYCTSGNCLEVRTDDIDYDDNQWHHLEVTYDGTSADTGIKIYFDGTSQTLTTTSPSSNITTSIANSTNVHIGSRNGAAQFFDGFLDDVKVFAYERTTTSVNTDTVKGASSRGSSAVFGQVDTAFLNDGLLGYWKLDETSGDAADSSGNNLTLTNSGTTDYTGGKFGNGSEHVPASVAYLGTATTISGVKTVSFWVNPDSTTNYYIGLTTTAYINSSSGTLTATGFTSSIIYVDGMESSTIVADRWQLVTVITQTAINANQFLVGTDGTNLFDGAMDDVRLYNRVLSSGEIRNLYNWEPGPVGHWKFDENTGTSTTNDSSGNNLVGTMTSMEESDWITGKYGSALDFDGSAEYITVSDNALLRANNGSWTISLWAKPSDTDQTSVLISKRLNSAPFEQWSLWICGDTNCGSNGQLLNFLYIQEGGNSDRRAISTTDVTDGNWHHYAAVADKDANTVRIYMDGSLLSATNTTNGGWPTIDTNDPLRIANSNGTNYFGGPMDDVKVYNYARTGAQVIEDMNGGHPLGGSPIGSQVAFWGLDEQYGTTVNNKTPNTFTTAISGATWRTKENCKINGCLEFDGTDDVLTITNATSIDLNNNLAAGFTVTAWVYADSDGENDVGQIFQKGDADTYLRVDSQDGSNNLDLQAGLALGAAGTGDDAILNIADAFTTGTWNHVAVGYTDDGDDEISIYINGKLRGTSIGGSGSPEAESGNLLIGGATTANFDGKIDEFKIYSSELTAEQVGIDYNANSSINFATGYDEALQIVDGAGNPPISYWSFDENTGTTANDKSGNAQTGTLTNGPTWGPGKFGSGIVFDGSNDRVNVTDNAIHDLTSGFTEEAWVYVTGGSGNYRDIIFKGVDTGGAENPTFYMQVTNANNFEVGFTDISTGFVFADSTTTVALNKWYHVVGTFSNASNRLRIYVNGVLEATTTTTANPQTNADPLIIGIGNTSNFRPFPGRLDEIKIYDYERTPAQIAYDYNRGGPLAWYKLDECTGTTINNSAQDGNGDALGNNGTLTLGASPASGTCTTSGAWFNGAIGKFNASMDFDGTDDYIQVADAAALRFNTSTEDFSLFAWAKRSTTGTEYIISKEDADNDGWRLLFTSGDAVQCSQDATDVTSASTITDTNWHFIGCTIDRDGNGQVYIDGKPNGSTASMGTDTMATTSNIRIGTRSYTSTSYFNGQIDEVQIYNYALSPAQVLKIHNNNSVGRFGPVEGQP